MAALLLLVLVTMVLDHWLLLPLARLFTALLDGSWAGWLLLFSGLWLLSGPPRSR